MGKSWVVIIVAMSLLGLTACTVRQGDELYESYPEMSVSSTPLPPLPVLAEEKPYETLIYEQVKLSYEDVGLTLSSQDWEGLQTYICDDLAAGGAGEWTLESATILPDASQRDLTYEALAAATLEECPSLEPPKVQSTQSSMVIAMSYMYLYDQSKRRAQYNEALLDYQSRYGVNVSSLLQDASISLPGGSGGRSVRCEDGTFSQSGGKQGACSWHGGIDK